MEFRIWLLIVVVASILIAIGKAAITANKKKRMTAELRSLPNFDPTQQVLGADGASGLALDEPRKKLCLIKHAMEGVSVRLVSYTDILSVEVFEDGDSITKTVRSSQIGTALVGGLVLGGVGALVGGLSGKTRTSSQIKRVDLRLIVNDTKSPVHDVAFMNVEAKKGGLIYSRAIESARHWHGLIEVLIKRAEAENRVASSDRAKIQPALLTGSIADEVKKLADLYKSGVLTADEFTQQKAKLLAGPSQSV